MLDLVQYALDHNVSIELSPISKVPKVVNIIVRKGNHQIHYYANLDSLTHSDNIIESVLDESVSRLKNIIRDFEMLNSGDCEVSYHE